MGLLAGMALLIVPMLVSGATNPVIVGTISGFELCPQSVCDKAYFAGQFAGTVKGKPTAGVFSVGVTHGDLPETTGGTAPITGGTWMVRTKKKVFAGTVATGTLTYNGDDTYTVALTLTLTEGGSGTLQFTGLLDHGPFPPTIVGTLSQ
jgi:hypothetical protein